MKQNCLIFSNRFEQPNYDELLNDSEIGNSDNNSVDEFLKTMEKNRKIIPNQKRLADKDKFISAVRHLSEEYEIDADLEEMDCGYNATLYMCCASYSGYIKKLLNIIFILADEYSVFIKNDNKNYDYILVFTYHTHNVYLKDREITDFL